MINIRITDNLASVFNGLDTTARAQLPFATALALTRTAKAVERVLRSEIRQVFDNPTPFIARATYVMPATKHMLSSTVGMMDNTSNGRAGPAMYVKEFFAGGTRDLKPFERALRKIGALPAGYKALPGADLKTDRYGNPDRKMLTEIIGALSSGMSTYAGRGKRQARVGYFIVMPGAKGRAAHFKQPGIYRRIERGRERAARPVLVFEPVAQYRKRIDLPALAARVVAREFEPLLQAALAQATQSAR